MTPARFHCFVAPSAGARLAAARAYVRAHALDQVLIVGATRASADELALGVARAGGALVGVSRASFGELATKLALPVLAERLVSPGGALGAEAMATRAAFDALAAGDLTYFGPVADLPGFPRALARTLSELQQARVDAAALSGLEHVGPDLAGLLTRVQEEARRAGTVSRAATLTLAAQRLRAQPEALGAHHVLLLDVAPATEVERALVAAVVEAATTTLATVPAGDTTTLAAYEHCGGAVEPPEPAVVPASGAAEEAKAGAPASVPSGNALARLQRWLFASDAPPVGELDPSVQVLSAPGEGREAVEIVRRVLQEAAAGVPLDEVAVLLRAPHTYLGLLEHAFARAGVPVWFERGTRRPDPAGRAFLALLACADEGLSARRFAEYLSLGQVPNVTGPGTVTSSGAADSATFAGSANEVAEGLIPPSERPEDPAPLDEAPAASERDGDRIVAGTLRAPWRWEELLVEAYVIEGLARWQRRLPGLRREFDRRMRELADEDHDAPRLRALERDRQQLEHLESFALPIVATLDEWRSPRTWAEWLRTFSELLPRVLRQPVRVARVLAEMAPLGTVGPVRLREVREVLAPRLLTLTNEPPRRRHGRVFVGTPHAARGRQFRVVFVPGLAERIFPQRLREDALLVDARRARLDAGLPMADSRADDERLQLRLAVGAAAERAYLSYPRLELAESRPRVPSFYVLDVMRATTGVIPRYDALAEAASAIGSASLDWPAPADPNAAIDDLEHDLAVLKPLLRAPLAQQHEHEGRARYLLELNPALRRSVVERWSRWQPRWSPADGLIRVQPLTAPALAAQRLTARPYSLTALQRFAACPYQFQLAAIYQLAPLDEPAPLQRLDPLTRGSLFHEIQTSFFRHLVKNGLLPLSSAHLKAVQGQLDWAITEVTKRAYDDLAPAIDRVWRDEIDGLRRDLRLWLDQQLLPDAPYWLPERFELGFGLPLGPGRDPASAREPVRVGAAGYLLRGSIDLVERRITGTHLRVTDHKTGKNRTTPATIVDGGRVLQPVLYAVALEALTGQTVDEGRLSYCTSAGGFTARPIALDDAHPSARSGSARDHRPRRRTRHAGGQARDVRPACGVRLLRLPRGVRSRRSGAHQEEAGRAGPRRVAEDAVIGGSADVDDRRLIAEALDQTLVVEAAAGTGKTTELVKRIVRLVSSGRAVIDEIVAVTFSEKAAGELKLRLREELERARHTAGGDESIRLERAVQRFEEAHVSTIHGFCADLLRERPVEARIDPSFVVLTEGQAGRLFDEAFADWIQHELDQPCEGVRRSLRRATARRFGGDEEDDAPIERLKRAGRDLLEWRDHPTPWRRPEGFDRTGSIDHLLDAIGSFSALSATPTNPRDPLCRDTEPIRRVWAEVDPLRARGFHDYDGWESALVNLATRHTDLRKAKNTSGLYGKDVPRAAVVDARDRIVAALVAFRDCADADLAALVHEAMQDAVRRYETRKQRAGAVDFLDLLIRARDLVRDDAAVRHDFQRRFRYLLVDEFQDTDPLQAELLMLLAADEADGAGSTAATLLDGRIRPGALFIVGDPKQSIYRFRRADVGIYREICERLVARGAVRVRLRTSFRSVPAIQRAVNAAFSVHMTGDRQVLQADYVELQAARDDHAGQPAVVALPVPHALSDRGNVTQAAIAASLPEAVGEFVRWLVVDSGYTVPDEHAEPGLDGTSPRRPIRAGDVCLLFRRFLDYQTDVTRLYVEALEARGLTHLLVGGKAFHEREEVDALRTALTAIEWPDDALSVFATLRGPFFAVAEEELLAWHALGHGFRPYHVPEQVPDALTAVALALGVLRDLNRLRNHRPVADTIGRLIEATRAHAGFVLWRGGEQVLANVLQIAELARRYEAEGGLSFRGFVDELRDAAGRAPTPEAPILEEGTDGVRLMTVHKAKGLEFPVVILADIGCRLSREEAQRHLDGSRGLAAIKLAGWAPLDLRDNNLLEASRDAAEGVRLAYVAATRARDLLVVPAIGDGPQEKQWVHPLSAALYGGEAVAADGVPAFTGRDTHLDRPPNNAPTLHTMRPGAYAHVDPVTRQPYTVVWWDPLLLEKPGAERRGLRHEHLIGKDAPAAVVAADRARYEQWRHAREATLVTSAAPSLRVMTATEWARASLDGAVGTPPELADAAAGVEVVALEAAEAARPSGRRFGTLVHALLAHVALEAAPGDIGQMASVQARMLGATDAERAAAATVAGALLGHPLLARARAAAAAGRVCRREVPLVLTVDALLVDGQADLLWDDGDGWMVLDFKTDIELGASTALYARQVAVYLEALRRATGRPARGALLRA